MNQKDRRQLENQLLSMGLPALGSAELVQVMADMVNAYPIPSERPQFFCDLLNECEGSKRPEMYNALKPLLHFKVPTLAEVETAITYKAERMVNRKTSASADKAAVPDGITVKLNCHGCQKEAEFSGLTIADGMAEARKAGWGRGPVPGEEYCAECRFNAFVPNLIAPQYTRRHSALDS